MPKSKTLAQYTQPHQFEPLLPQKRLDELRARTRALIGQSLRLAGGAHATTIASLRELVRAMNSYYSNRIEGQSTHPLNIARALRSDFSDRPDVARLQRLALAHIEAERELERRVDAGTPPLTADFLRQAHAAVYGRLPAEDRVLEGEVVAPGALRGRAVAVGRHEPPPAEALPAFLARFDEAYARACPLEDMLFTIAAAHQRMAWVHPFLDGNGRVCRLQTHCALWPLSAGLWSVSPRLRARARPLLRAARGGGQPAPGRPGRPRQPEREGAVGLVRLVHRRLRGPGAVHGGPARPRRHEDAHPGAGRLPLGARERLPGGGGAAAVSPVPRRADAARRVPADDRAGRAHRPRAALASHR
jgi:Uncharacterized conserved protein